MTIPVYQIGDLVILKPELWRSMPEHENVVGVIVEIGVQVKEKKSFFVRFEKLVHILNDRIIWADDILQHYPVVK